jgi:hypothetical protein
VVDVPLDPDLEDFIQKKVDNVFFGPMVHQAPRRFGFSDEGIRP